MKAIHGFFEAFNARDNEAMRKTMHFPHVRIASGGVKVYETASDYDLPEWVGDIEISLNVEGVRQ